MTIIKHCVIYFLKLKNDYIFIIDILTFKFYFYNILIKQNIISIERFKINTFCEMKKTINKNIIQKYFVFHYSLY